MVTSALSVGVMPGNVGMVLQHSLLNYVSLDFSGLNPLSASHQHSTI